MILCKLWNKIFIYLKGIIFSKSSLNELNSLTECLLFPGFYEVIRCLGQRTLFRTDQRSTFLRDLGLRFGGVQLRYRRYNEKYKNDVECWLKTLVSIGCSPLMHLPWFTFKSKIFFPSATKLFLVSEITESAFFFFIHGIPTIHSDIKTGSGFSLPRFKS